MGKKNTRFMMAVFGGSAALIGAAFGVSQLLMRPPPPPAPPPTAPGQAAPPEPTDIKCTEMHYQAVTKEFAAKYQAKAPSLDELRRPLPGGSEFRGAAQLKAKGGKLDTDHLRLATSIEKLSATADGQGFSADHLVLSITNKSDVPLAYRVRTRVALPERCGSMAQLPHNAIALRPKETVRRTECLFASKQRLTVTEVEVYELTDLGHRYVSRLPPLPGGPFDLRVAAAHTPGEIPVCRSVPWRDFEGGTDPWLSLIDFHARHDCDEYPMPKDYRPQPQPAALPVCVGR